LARFILERAQPAGDETHMTGRVETVTSPNIRAAFGNWLTSECQSGARLIVLEGLSQSGKSYLTERPFAVGARQSTNIEIDGFLRAPVPPTVRYPDAIDRVALQATLEMALALPMSVVIIEGPMAWPLVEPISGVVTRDRIRRVYLKRMMRLKPDFWIDEDYLNDPIFWPPTDYHRAIYQYHAEHQPWLDADLVLERVED
jgi:hypothetical protein